MPEWLKVAIICLLVLVAYGIVGEIDYQEQLEQQRFAAEYYAGLK